MIHSPRLITVSDNGCHSRHSEIGVEDNLTDICGIGYPRGCTVHLSLGVEQNGGAGSQPGRPNFVNHGEVFHLNRFDASSGPRKFHTETAPVARSGRVQFRDDCFVGQRLKRRPCHADAGGGNDPQEIVGQVKNLEAVSSGCLSVGSLNDIDDEGQLRFSGCSRSRIA